MLTSLLRSAAALRVFGILYLSPERAFQLGDIVAAMPRSGEEAVSRLTVIRLLRDFVADRIVVKEEPPLGHPRYRANRSSYLFDELQGIAIKTLGGHGDLIQLVDRDPNVVAAAIFGSFADGTQRADSDLDLLMIATDATSDRLLETLSELQAASVTIGRTLAPVVFTENEWTSKRRSGAPFVERILREPRIDIKGTLP